MPVDGGKKDDASHIGYIPQDDASRFGSFAENGDPITRRYQGGAFTAQDYTRGD